MGHLEWRGTRLRIHPPLIQVSHRTRRKIRPKGNRPRSRSPRSLPRTVNGRVLVGGWEAGVPALAGAWGEDSVAVARSVVAVARSVVAVARSVVVVVAARLGVVAARLGVERALGEFPVVRGAEWECPGEARWVRRGEFRVLPAEACQAVEGGCPPAGELACRAARCLPGEFRALPGGVSACRVEACPPAVELACQAVACPPAVELGCLAVDCPPVAELACPAVDCPPVVDCPPAVDCPPEVDCLPVVDCPPVAELACLVVDCLLVVELGCLRAVDCRLWEFQEHPAVEPACPVAGQGICPRDLRGEVASSLPVVTFLVRLPAELGAVSPAAERYLRAEELAASLAVASAACPVAASLAGG